MMSLGQMLNKQRGKAPKGRRWVHSSVYMPAGPHCNVKPTRIRNPKIAAHVKAMHDKWYANKFGVKS